MKVYASYNTGRKWVSITILCLFHVGVHIPHVLLEVISIGSKWLYWASSLSLTIYNKHKGLNHVTCAARAMVHSTQHPKPLSSWVKMGLIFETDLTSISSQFTLLWNKTFLTEIHYKNYAYKTCGYTNCKQFNEIQVCKSKWSLYKSKPSSLYYKYYQLHNYIIIFTVTEGKASKQLHCIRYSTDIWGTQFDFKVLHFVHYTSMYCLQLSIRVKRSNNGSVEKISCHSSCKDTVLGPVSFQLLWL